MIGVFHLELFQEELLVVLVVDRHIHLLQVTEDIPEEAYEVREVEDHEDKLENPDGVVHENHK